MTTPTRSARRAVDGVVLLDKPAGLTSNAALQTVKRLFNARKAGHTGSLDPLATGLLPLCFGEATKISGLLLASDKRYRARVRLGLTTDTGDVTGQVLTRQPLPDLTPECLQRALSALRGEILQVPPMYSALKQAGQPLYRLARQGITVDRAPRRVTIHTLDLLAWGADWLEIDVFCSKGTYLRSLAEAIGERLGCGATLETLRRTQTGPFHLADAWTLPRLHELAAQHCIAEALLPVDSALCDWPALTLTEHQAQALRHGQPLRGAWPPLADAAPTTVRLYAAQGFLGWGALHAGVLRPLRLLAQTMSGNAQDAHGVDQKESRPLHPIAAD